MIKYIALYLALGSSLAPQMAIASPPPTCTGQLAVEVLGSGGPIADDARASTSYILWVDGHAKILIDAGGGAFLRYGEAGAQFDDLDAILISHYHADHIADLPAILKSGFFGERERILLISGPSGSKRYPGLNDFLAAQFDPEKGAYRYLSGYLEDTQNELAYLHLLEIDIDNDQQHQVIKSASMTINAIAVDHGPVPALGYIISAYGKTIVFGGDQSAASTAFDAALKDSQPDLLILHHAIAQAPGQPRHLHRDPASMGALAASSKTKHLVLSHNMGRALNAWEDGYYAIRMRYDGPLDIAEDHACYTVIK